MLAVLDLNDLAAGQIPAITPAMGGSLPETIEEILNAMEVLNKSGLAEPRERIPGIHFLKHFLHCAKRIAPDGEQIREVALSSNAGTSRSVIITRTKSQVPNSSATGVEPELAQE